VGKRGEFCRKNVGEPTVFTLNSSLSIPERPSPPHFPALPILTFGNSHKKMQKARPTRPNKSLNFPLSYLLVLEGFIGMITKNAAAKPHSVKNVHVILINAKVYTD
jgi:hypothetical protein